MNIYLDIDGVLLGTASPIEDVRSLTEHILRLYPGRVFWLTTHCSSKENRCSDWLRRGGFPEDLVRRLEAGVRPAHWRTWKTEAIDFSQPFFWLDDGPLQGEIRRLEERGARSGLILMDKRDPRSARLALERIRAFEAGLTDPGAASPPEQTQEFVPQAAQGLAADKHGQGDGSA